MGPFPVSSRAGERNAPQDSPPPWPCLATAALPPLAAARVVPRSSSRPAVRFPGRRPAPRTIAPRAKRHPGPDPALPPATPRRPAPRRPSAAEPPPPPPRLWATWTVRVDLRGGGEPVGAFSNLAEVGEGLGAVAQGPSSRGVVEASCEGGACCLSVSVACSLPKFRPPKGDAIQRKCDSDVARRRATETPLRTRRAENFLPSRRGREPRRRRRRAARARRLDATCELGPRRKEKSKNSRPRRTPPGSPRVATAGVGPPPPVSVVGDTRRGDARR